MNSLRRAAKARLGAWAARRHGADSLPHTIAVRRIYILPTRYGLLLGALIAVMLLAGLNYNSNLGLGFAFLMASVGLVAMHHCHRNLLGMRVDAAAEALGLAGGEAQLQFLLENPSAIDRYDIEIRCSPQAAGIFAVPAGARRGAAVAMPLASRGVIRLTQFEIATRYPFGWFRAWTYVQTALDIYSAPQPHGSHRPPPASGARGRSASAASSGDEEFAGLRAYAPGMPLKHMAWKALARGGEAAVRHYAGPASAPQWLDWAALPGLESEARLSQLSRWVLDGAAARRRYGLRIPGSEIEPAEGAAQRDACLRALAAFGAAEPR